MNFVKASNVLEEPGIEGAYWFLYLNNDILIEEISEEEIRIPRLGDVALSLLEEDDTVFLGMLDGVPCYAANQADSAPFQNYTMMNLRTAYGRMDDALWRVAGYGRHLLEWLECSRFCGKCGAETDYIQGLGARQCLDCDYIIFPRIAPAVIVAVTCGDKILLARGARFPNRKMYSVLAGFVDPGETLEECVQREVFEEVGIQVKNITYFGSQPWPFPDSLMVGFKAEYESGDICVDEDEIVEADWFSADEMPVIPSKSSISRQLIDDFLKK